MDRFLIFNRSMRGGENTVISNQSLSVINHQGENRGRVYKGVLPN